VPTLHGMGGSVQVNRRRVSTNTRSGDYVTFRSMRSIRPANSGDRTVKYQ
jgi:hypothetical protein